VNGHSYDATPPDKSPETQVARPGGRFSSVVGSSPLFRRDPGGSPVRRTTPKKARTNRK
jgi:hypothetical protein